MRINNIFFWISLAISMLSLYFFITKGWPLFFFLLFPPIIWGFSPQNKSGSFADKDNLPPGAFVRPRFCPNCGYELQGFESFCPICGYKLEA